MLTSRLFVPFILLGLFGVGCAPKLPSIVPVKPPTQPSSGVVRPTQGFGKLPSLGQLAVGKSVDIGTGEINANSVGADLASAQGSAPTADVAVGVGIASPAMPIRPPVPYPAPRPVLVKYVVEGKMPTWGKEGEVLKSISSLPGGFFVTSLASSAGLPKQLTGSITALQSLNASWRDADKLLWSYDAGSRTLGFWSDEQAIPQDGEKAREVKDGQIIAAADRFLEEHGFSGIRELGGTLQDPPQILPMMKESPVSSLTPCVYEGAGGTSVNSEIGVGAQGSASSFRPKETSAVPSGVSASDVAPSIYPYPCGWWPQTATVIYPMMRDGKRVMDAYGNEQGAASVVVNLRTVKVTGGNVSLEDAVERSKYPLIDAKTAEQYLMSGGRNPIYPWSENGKNITVRLTRLDLAWLRVESWQGTELETYWIPGLRATGSVDRGVKGQEQETYQTVIPLVEEGLFEDSQTLPEPIPLGQPAAI